MKFIFFIFMLFVVLVGGGYWLGRIGGTILERILYPKNKKDSNDDPYRK